MSGLKPPASKSDLIRARTSYDQGAPNDGINPTIGQPYRLATQVVVDAIDEAGTVVETLLTTLTGYEKVDPSDEKSGWDLGQATTTTIDMDSDGVVSSGDITRTTRYDHLGRVIEQRQPKSNGNDAGTRQTVYYTGGTSSVAACGNKPAWSGYMCQEGPKAQPAGQTMPTTVTTGYRWDGQVTETKDVSGSVTLTTTTTYDEKDRPVGSSSSVTGLASATPVPATNTTYDDATGLKTGVSSQGGHQNWTYDSWGRALSYMNYATGNTDTTTTTYNVAGQVTGVVDPLGTTAYTYDGTDALGNSEYRGLVTKVEVFNSGGTHYVSTGAYDAAGVLVEEHLPGQVIKRTSWDRVGKLTGVTYSGPVASEPDPDTGKQTIEADQPWFGWATIQNVQGQVVREWTPNGGSAYTQTQGAQAVPGGQHFTYDRAGRLVGVVDATGILDDNGDLTADACQTRTYTFDANGNRTSQATIDGVTNNTCNTTGGTTTSRAYVGGGTGASTYGTYWHRRRR